ncbi:MAG: 30S ribosomal protein S21 [Deltaproteobacteria bacterium]|nr:30S ribosomal protein S21 [Deltaproteobacteria bacterium]
MKLKEWKRDFPAVRVFNGDLDAAWHELLAHVTCAGTFRLLAQRAMYPNPSDRRKAKARRSLARRKQRDRRALERQK